MLLFYCMRRHCLSPPLNTYHWQLHPFLLTPPPPFALPRIPCASLLFSILLGLHKHTYIRALGSMFVTLSLKVFQRERQRERREWSFWALIQIPICPIEKTQKVNPKIIHFLLEILTMGLIWVCGNSLISKLVFSGFC